MTTVPNTARPDTARPDTARDEAHQLCRLAFDLNSAALALAAEAAEIACRGLPLRDHDLRLVAMSRTLADLVADLEGGATALRRARLSAAWVRPVSGHSPAIPAE